MEGQHEGNGESIVKKQIDALVRKACDSADIDYDKSGRQSVGDGATVLVLKTSQRAHKIAEALVRASANPARLKSLSRFGVGVRQVPVDKMFEFMDVLKHLQGVAGPGEILIGPLVYENLEMGAEGFHSLYDPEERIPGAESIYYDVHRRHIP